MSVLSLCFLYLFLTLRVSAGPVNYRKTPITVPLVRRGSALSYPNGTFNFNALAHHLNQLDAKYERTFKAYQTNKGRQHPMLSNRTQTVHKRSHVTTVDLVYTVETSVFTGEVEFGDQGLIVEFDTATADCIVEPSKYNPRESETSTDMDQQFYRLFHDHTYADGSVWLDRMEIAGLEIPDVAIGVTHHSFLPASRHPAEGVCGLAFQELSVFGEPGFFFDAVSNDRVENGIIGISLSRHGSSELTIGDINHNLYHHMEFVHLIPHHEGFWQVQGEIQGAHDDFTASFVLDSTAAVISTTIENARQIFSVLGVKAASQNLDVIGMFPCNRPPAVNFQFGQSRITLNHDAVIMGNLGRNRCILPIVGSSTITTDNVILGRPFFESVYLAFSVDQGAVGFGTH